MIHPFLMMLLVTPAEAPQGTWRPQVGPAIVVKEETAQPAPAPGASDEARPGSAQEPNPPKAVLKKAIVRKARRPR